MIDAQVFWLCILVSIIGISVIFGIIYFGRSMFKINIGGKLFAHPFLDELFHRFLNDPNQYYNDIPRFVSEGYSDYLQRRNEFWNTYGQVLIAVLIIIVLTILLLTKAISAEAGLPILSGVSGFAIAKGVSGAKTINIPQERQRG